MSKPSVAVSMDRQIPEFIRADYELLVKFIKYYYQFLGQEHDRELEKLRSIETTLEQLLATFRVELGVTFPTANLADERFLLRNIRELYHSKGSEEAIKYIFRSFFAEEVNIIYPSQQILRASDGRWLQESFITLNLSGGTIPKLDTEKLLFIENQYGSFRVVVTRIQLVDVANSYVRFYFKSKYNIKVTDRQKVIIFDQSGNKVATGRLVPSPSYLKVVNPGKYWQRGQVITFPAKSPGIGVETLNTIARVIDVESDGAIKTLEVLEHGYRHDDASLVISPFPNKPSGTTYDITSTYNIVTGGYDYVLTIDDETNGYSEVVYGYSDAYGANSYFLEDYVARAVTAYASDNEAYNSQVVIAQSFEEIVNDTVWGNLDITIGEWLESRATLVYTFDNIVRTKGKYENSAGQVSNQEIHLQDNYYYQLFSYVLETTHNVSAYSDIISSFHPAGMKRFSNVVKAASFDIATSGSRVVDRDTMYINDQVTTTSSIPLLQFTTTKSDSAVITEAALIGNKYALNDTTALPTSTTITVLSNPYQNIYSGAIPEGTIDYEIYGAQGLTNYLPSDGQAFFSENYSSKDIQLGIDS